MESSANIYFVTNENKGLLWKLLENGNIFNDISNEYVSTIKNEFDKKIQQINTSPVTVGYSLMELNKMFISEMITHVGKFKDIVRKNKESSRPSSSLNNTFQNALEKKKEDFNALMMNKPHDKVDFSDKLDDTPIGSNNIEAILAETIARRERELNVVLDKQPKNGIINTSKLDTNIKIGDDLKKDDVIKVKQVRFSDKVEMKEHLNIEYEDTLDEVQSDAEQAVQADAVQANHNNTKENRSNEKRLITRQEYDNLLEKIDSILIKSKQDILDMVHDLLNSTQQV